MELALLGAQVGVYPTFIWKRGKGGKVKDCAREAKERPPIEEFLGHAAALTSTSSSAIGGPAKSV